MRGVLRYHVLETPLVLLGTLFVNICVICVFAEGFYGTDQEIGLQAAGDLLAETFGSEFKLFWALGLLAAGQVSTIALTYAGQLIMAGLLRIEVKGWTRMAATRLVALVPALTGAHAGSGPARAAHRQPLLRGTLLLEPCSTLLPAVAVVSNANNKFDSLNQMLNVVQSIQLPFALIPVRKRRAAGHRGSCGRPVPRHTRPVCAVQAIHIASSRAVMGKAFATSRLLTLFCSLVALTVTSINGYFLVQFRHDNLPAGAGACAQFNASGGARAMLMFPPPFPAGVSVGWGFLMAAYYASIACFAVGPDRLAVWAAPYMRHARLSLTSRTAGVGTATARAAGGLVTWAKGINWRDPESLLEIHL